jgi:ParB family chromosome partitioning protein
MNENPPLSNHLIPAPDRLIDIAVADLVESKDNPRKTLDAAKEKSLVESIRSKGVIEPLLLRLSESWPVTIVEGARRFRAAKEAGLRTVPAIVRNLTDEQVIEIQLISFVQKADIHPLDEAEAYDQLRRKSFDIAQISAKVGKERSYIAKRLQLVNLIEPAKKALRSNTIFLEHALLIARLQPKDQEKTLEYTLDSNENFGPTGMPASIDDLKGFIRLEFELDLRKASFDKKDLLLIENAGSCVSCPKRTGFNRDLFNDITAADRCMDPACFELKMRAHLLAIRKRLEAEGKTVVLITSELRKPSFYPDSITVRSYVKAAPGSCSHVATGLLVGGPNRGKVLTICNDRTCKKRRSQNAHNMMGVGPEPKIAEGLEKERIKRVQEEIFREIGGRLNTALMPLIIKALPDEISKYHLELIYDVLNDTIFSDVPKSVLRLLGLEGKPQNWSAKDLLKVVRMFAMIERAENGFGGYEDTIFIEEAKRLGIFVPSIEKNIRATVEAEYAEELKSKLKAAAPEKKVAGRSPEAERATKKKKKPTKKQTRK